MAKEKGIGHMLALALGPLYKSNSHDGIVMAIASLLLIAEIATLFVLVQPVRMGETELRIDDLSYSVQPGVSGRREVGLVLYLSNTDFRDSGKVRVDIKAVNVTIQDRNIVDDQDVLEVMSVQEMTTTPLEASLNLAPGRYRIDVIVFEEMGETSASDSFNIVVE